MEKDKEPAAATVEEAPRHRKILRGQMVETQEMRCPKCGRFLGWQAVIWGLVKIKCTNSKCKEWITLDIRPNA